MKRYYSLDAIRFLCAFVVLLHHVGPPPRVADLGLGLAYGAVWFGPAAVVVFFVLSGFCIHRPWCGSERVDWPAYFARRSLRILPPLVVVVALGAVVGVSYHPVHGAVTWSLACEIVYYAAYPLLRPVWRRCGWAATIGAAFVIGTLAVVVSLGRPDDIGLTFLRNILSFLPAWLLGCAVAERGAPWPAMPRTGAAPPRLWCRRAVVLGLAVAAGIAHYQGVISTAWTMPAFAIPVAWWIGAEFATGGRPSWLSDAGAWSYSLYLVHPVAIAVAAALLHGGAGPWSWPLTIPLVLAMSYGFFRLCERPAHDLARRTAAAVARRAAAVEATPVVLRFRHAHVLPVLFVMAATACLPGVVLKTMQKGAQLPGRLGAWFDANYRGLGLPFGDGAGLYVMMAPYSFEDFRPTVPWHVPVHVTDTATAGVAGYTSPYDIVVIGDSYSTGSGMDGGQVYWQDYLFELTGLTSLTIHGDLNRSDVVGALLASPAFRTTPPRVVIYESIHYTLGNFAHRDAAALPDPPAYAGPRAALECRPTPLPRHLVAHVPHRIHDPRQLAGRAFANLISMASGANPPFRPGTSTFDSELTTDTLFSNRLPSRLLYSNLLKALSAAERDTILDTLARYRAAVEANGYTRFLVMVMPMKEEVYRPYMKKPVDIASSYRHIVADRRIAAVDMLDVFQAALGRGVKDLYIPSDEHAGPEGHRLIAETLAARFAQAGIMSGCRSPHVI